MLKGFKNLVFCEDKSFTTMIDSGHKLWASKHVALSFVKEESMEVQESSDCVEHNPK